MIKIINTQIKIFLDYLLINFQFYLKIAKLYSVFKIEEFNLFLLDLIQKCCKDKTNKKKKNK